MTRLAARAVAAAHRLAASAAGCAGRRGRGGTGLPEPARFAVAAPRPDLCRAQSSRTHGKLTILAMGSSSTAGIGASSPAATYPSRLEAELRKRFPDTDIRVINRGKGGRGRTGGAGSARARRRRRRPRSGDLADRHECRAAPARSGRRTRRAAARHRADQAERGRRRADGPAIRPARPRFARVCGDGKADRRSRGANRVGLFRRFEIMRHWLSDAPAEARDGDLGGRAAHDGSQLCLPGRRPGRCDRAELAAVSGGKARRPRVSPRCSALSISGPERAEP